MRISLGGGGTDLPFYAQRRGGLLMAAAIDEYVTVSVATRILDDKILVQTTDTQFADSLEGLKNDLVRACLEFHGWEKGIQVAMWSTIPTGIGLGSSSTQIVGLVYALSRLSGEAPSQMEVAARAHKIEREILGFAGGIQDQYISAIGGVQKITAEPDGTVTTSAIRIAPEVCERIEEGLKLVYSGRRRDSAEVVKSQEVELQRKLDIYDKIKRIGVESEKLLVEGDIQALGEALHEHWTLKKGLSALISDTRFDEQYQDCLDAGANGGKLVGAGGGGFFLMAVPGDPVDFAMRLRSKGYRILDWRFEFQGTHLISS